MVGIIGWVVDRGIWRGYGGGIKKVVILHTIKLGEIA